MQQIWIELTGRLAAGFGNVGEQLPRFVGTDRLPDSRHDAAGTSCRSHVGGIIRVFGSGITIREIEERRCSFTVVSPVVRQYILHKSAAGFRIVHGGIYGNLVISHSGEDLLGDRHVLRTTPIDHEVLELVFRVLFMSNLRIQVLLPHIEKRTVEGTTAFVLIVAHRNDVGNRLIVGNAVECNAGQAGSAGYFKAVYHQVIPSQRLSHHVG